MPDTTWNGVFWLPEYPQRGLRGSVQFGAHLELALNLQLEPPTPLPPGTVISFPASIENRQYPVVFGRVDDVGDVTLVDVLSLFWPGPLEANHTDAFRYAIEGAHVPATNLACDQFTFETDCLLDWVNPPAIHLSSKHSIEVPRTEHLDFASHGARVKLVTYPEMHVSATKASAQATTSWSIDVESPMSVYEGLNSWIAPLRNLISLLTGAANRITFLMAKFQSTPRPLPIHMPLLGDDLKQRDKSLLEVRQVGPLSALANAQQAIDLWLDAQEKLEGVVTRVIVATYAPFMFEDDRVTNIAQAAEAMHVALWNHPNLPTNQHEARVRIIVDAAPSELREWASSVLSPANQPSFKTRMVELVEQAIKAGMPLAPGDIDTFANHIRNARNLPSHGSNLYAGCKDPEELYYELLALDWIVRLILLSNIGLSPAWIHQRLCKNEQFILIAKRLSWTAQPFPPTPAFDGEPIGE